MVKKTAEGHLCQFVDSNGSMHKKFRKHLRPDGMGIDYDNITFRWKDPDKKSKLEWEEAGKEKAAADDEAGDDGDDREEEEEK